MKLRIFLDMFELGIGFHEFPRAFCALAQIVKQLVGKLRNPNRIDFQCFAKVVKILDFLRGETPEIRATAGFDANQALGVQAVESFAHRRLANAELFGKKLFGQPGLFIEVFAKDVGLDAGVCESGKVLRSLESLHRLLHDLLHSIACAT